MDNPARSMPFRRGARTRSHMALAGTTEGSRADRSVAARWEFAAIGILIAFVAVVRFVGIGFQLPISGLADERVYIEHIAAFQSGAPDPAALPGAAAYPYLVSKIALATWHAPVCTNADVADHLATASSLAVRIRRVVAALSLLAIPGMWLLVRRFSSGPMALVATALCSTSLFGQVFAQQGRPHGAVFGLSLVALGLAVWVQRRPTFVLAALAGIAAALSFATLQSGLALLVPVVVAIVLGRGIGLGRRCALLATAVVPTWIALRWAYAFLFVEHIDRRVQPGHSLIGEGVFSLQLLEGSGFGTMARALWVYDPILVVASALGFVAVIVFAIRSARARRRGANPSSSSSTISTESAIQDSRRAWLRLVDPRSWSDSVRAAVVVASYIVPYVILFGFYRLTFARYALPLVPFLAWGAAWLLTPRRARVGTWYAWIPAVLVLGTQSILVAKLSYVRALPNTLDEAARWIERETPPGSRIGVLASDDLPLLRLPEQRVALPTRFTTDPNRHWLAYQSRLGPGPWDAHARDIVTPRGVTPDQLIDELRTAGADYCLLRTYQYFQPKGFHDLRNDLLQRGRLVATFWPVDEPQPGPFATREEFQVPESFRPWIVRLAHARTTGNLVEIWALHPR